MKKDNNEEDLMNDDITFCYYTDCPNKECYRHISHIKVPYVPYSFGFFKNCEYWNLPEVYFTTSEK